MTISKTIRFVQSSNFTRTLLTAAAAAALLGSPVLAQGLQPGEAFVTRFSGTTTPAGGAAPAINVNGTSGSIIDLRSPKFPPIGIQWIGEPQRKPITAQQVGQVFGVVLDDANPPNIYLSATSAFGLHQQGGNWMPGMWGTGGGPGAIYKLDAGTGYQPRVFAHVTLNGRTNTGASLGNMAFDRVNHQIFVSDLETGMITRIRASDGTLLGTYDHGMTGRAHFIDALTRQALSLPTIPFNPGSSAQRTNCAAGPFEMITDCWNFAASGRRVWGVGVRTDPLTGTSRLYYSAWSSPAFGNKAWNTLSEDEKRNSVWSIALTADGSFNTADIRREFLLPDFFVQSQDIARAGYSQPVSDITFSACSPTPTMLVAERGGIRNLGLAAEDAFANPNEARALRYELDQQGNWQPVGRYDVGFYDRKNEGQPYIHANCAGGIAFGPGYTPDNAAIDASQPDQMVWITGNNLCSPDAPCQLPAGIDTQNTPQLTGDPSEVHGVQGLPAVAIDQLIPPAALGTYPADGAAYVSTGPALSYMIDTDVNIDASGNPITAEFIRNDATRIGDIAVYEICTPPTVAPILLPPPPPPGTPIAGHDPSYTHAMVASHGSVQSHYRIGSHNPWASHDPAQSHSVWGSHNSVVSSGGHFPVGSVIHVPPGSIMHQPPGSPIHLPIGSVTHFPPGSVIVHQPPGSVHFPIGSVNHFPPGSVHFPVGSINHNPPGSIHLPIGSLVHLPAGSVPTHQPALSVVHLPALSAVHLPVGSVVHLPAGSIPTHQPALSTIHLPALSAVHLPAGSTPTHLPALSVVHLPAGSTPTHQPILSAVHLPAGSTPTHLPALSVVHLPAGSTPTHLPALSVVHLPAGSTPTHQPILSAVHLPAGSTPAHNPPGSIHVPIGSAVHMPIGSTPVHLPIGSTPTHLPALSTVHLPAGSTPTHVPVGSLVHMPLGSTPVHIPAGSTPIHMPIGSTPVHFPAGSTPIHMPVGSTPVHNPPGSVHLPFGSNVVKQPFVQQHQPPGSVVHFPAPGSRKGP